MFFEASEDMLGNGNFVLEFFVAAVTDERIIAIRVNFHVLIVIAGITECLIAFLTLVRFVAEVSICMISILIFACEAFLANFALETPPKLGIAFHLVPYHVSLQVESPFEGLCAHRTHIWLWNIFGTRGMATQMLVQVSRRDKREFASVEGAFEGTHARVCANVAR